MSEDCSFCSNNALPEFDVHYPKTGVVHHCQACYVEYGHNQ